MIKKCIFIIILLIFFILMLSNIKFKEKFKVKNTKNNIFFTLKSISGLNLTFTKNNFYLTDEYPFIFEVLL